MQTGNIITEYQKPPTKFNLSLSSEETPEYTPRNEISDSRTSIYTNIYK